MADLRRVSWVAAHLLSRARASFLVSRPDPCPLETFDHEEFDAFLRAAAVAGRLDAATLRAHVDVLDGYLERLSTADPDALDGAGALAFWINAYNAAVLRTIAGTPDVTTMLAVPGAFTARRWAIGGERLSLDDIEHGKIRRFADPRIHFAIVCGALSCPTLRDEAYTAGRLASQLDDQTRSFLACGGAIFDQDAGVLRLSRLFRWYAGDFAYPRRMPSAFRSVLALSHRRSLLAFVVAHLPAAQAAAVDDAWPRIEFQPYDWTLGCTIGAAH